MATATPRGMKRGPVSDPSPPSRSATAAPPIRPDTSVRAPGSPVDRRRRLRKQVTAIPMRARPTTPYLARTDSTGR